MTDGVSLYRNTTTTLNNDPNDPADTPPVATYAFATHGRTRGATGSSFGGDGDFFIDIAIPWADLASVGIDRDTSVVAWAGSSSIATSLDGDLACHDGTTGAPTLSGTGPDCTVLDPASTPMATASPTETSSKPAPTRTTPTVTPRERQANRCSRAGPALAPSAATPLALPGSPRRCSLVSRWSGSGDEDPENTERFETRTIMPSSVGDAVSMTEPRGTSPSIPIPIPIPIPAR